MTRFAGYVTREAEWLDPGLARAGLQQVRGSGALRPFDTTDLDGLRRREREHPPMVGGAVWGLNRVVLGDVVACALKQQAHVIQGGLVTRGLGPEAVIPGGLGLSLKVGQDFVDLCTPKALQQGDHQSGQGGDAWVVAVVDGVDAQHLNLSGEVMRSGDDAESGAGETSPPAEPTEDLAHWGMP